MSTLIQDVKYGLRMLSRNPGFTTVAVLTLALGIGATTAIFSVIEAVLLRPLPYLNPNRLALLADPEFPEDPKEGGFLLKDLEACKSQAQTFEDMAFYYRDSGFSRVTLTANTEPELVQGAFVSTSFFSVMGVPPLMGRVFAADEERRGERVVILSHGLWLRRFGGSRGVNGKALQVNGIDSEIIGVMPERFQFPARDQQFWAPITTNPFWNDPQLTTNFEANRSHYFYARWQGLGRLKAGISLRQARTEMDTIFGRIKLADPDRNRGIGIRVVPLRVNVSGNTRLALLVLFGAVFFVLLIACSNVANLVLARGATRQREMAVRAALGAGRGRLARQLLTESTLISLFSGCVGIALAIFSVPPLVTFAPPDIPRLEQASVDPGVLVFALAISLFTVVVFGLAPAWKISRSDPHDSLKLGVAASTESAALKRLRGTLVTVEFALAVVLLTGAGLLVRSFLAVESVDPGFEPEHVLTMNVRAPAETPEKTNPLLDQVLERLRSVRGVGSAGAIDGLFELGAITNLGLRSIEGHVPEPRERWSPLAWQTVRGEYFRAMGVPLLRGRYFSEQDGPNTPLVAVIDESTARRYWPGEDPIGKRFKGQDRRGHNDEWLTVIGVVRDMRRSGVEKQAIPHVYEWYKQADSNTTDLVVRTSSDPRVVAATLRSLVRGVSPTAVLSPVRTLEQQLSEQLSPRRFQTWLLSMFSAAALLLAGIGIFGVMHYSVTQRTHEIGIRMALGARSQDVLRQVLGQGARLALAGVALGAGGALALTRVMSGLLFEVEPTDPWTFLVVVVLLMLVAVFASYVPARRATKVDPMVALRYE
jgi:putative ABC transport system permease protein